MVSQVRPRVRFAGVAGIAAALVLAGCSSSSDPDAGPSSSVSATASQPSTSDSPAASSSPSPTSTLTAEQQQAFDEATKVVMAYSQTLVDLYSGTRTRINDLDDVTTGDLHDRELKNVSQGLNQGYRSEPMGMQLVLVSAEPVKVNLKKDPNTIVVRACIDATAGVDISPDGTRIPGVREQLDYTVVRTNYLPDPGWAVFDVSGERDSEDRQC